MSLANALPPPWMIDTGLSQEAVRLRGRLAEFYNFSPSIALGEPAREVLAELDSVYAAALEEDRDGYEALPIQPAAYLEARAFLNALPLTLPAPEVSVDPDGEILLEWLLAPRRVFTISIAGSGILSYAGLFGVNRAHGAEQFTGRIPQAIRQGLIRLLGAGSTRG